MHIRHMRSWRRISAMGKGRSIEVSQAAQLFRAREAWLRPDALGWRKKLSPMTNARLNQSRFFWPGREAMLWLWSKAQPQRLSR